MEVALAVFGALVACLLTALLGGLAYHFRRIDARLAALKQKIDDTNDIVRRELRPNGGDSIFDRVSLIEIRLRDGDYRMGVLAGRIEDIQRDVKTVVKLDT